ncbi:MAG TPA: hypothetical protein RMH80_24090, partial [Polyangiaceae bacterium LLY-WYZ-15_(1-7)]|nr:hypothetical protein [Polyangiaceae bacterium LLY-WYZ-15_(1-7)]
MDPVDEPGALRDEDDDGVWAIVETHKNVGAIFTYRGKIRRSDLEAWREGTLGGALTLRQAYWVDEDPDSLLYAFYLWAIEDAITDSEMAAELQANISLVY